MAYTEKEILEELDLMIKHIPGKYYPKGRPQDIKYNINLDLEEGYTNVAGSRIHLYADSIRWAIVMEQNGFHTRASEALIVLNYVGNCIDYVIDSFPERNYITNSKKIRIIEDHEFERIENKDGEEMETFELIGADIKEIKLRDKMIPFNNDYLDYEKLGIRVRDYDNSKKLIGFEDFVRYLHETNPSLLYPTENEIRQHIPKDIRKLMTIDEFHFTSIYDEGNLLSQQETFQLIAKVLAIQDTTYWNPTQKANNSWKNWESATL